MSAAVVAIGAISALGRSDAAFDVGRVGEAPKSAVTLDPMLQKAGLARPFAARVDARFEEEGVSSLLQNALTDCIDALAAKVELAGKRIGLAVGTSAGGMRALEQIVEGSRSEVSDALYFAPLRDALSRISSVREWAPCSLVLGACASSTFAIGLGMRWLEQNECDVVIAGGFDSLSVFVAAGFEVLRATTAHGKSAPFRKGRDGMSLGEGAAFCALMRGDEAPSARFYIHGFGASSDAVHLTAPDREGGGLYRAVSHALTEAGNPEIDIVSAHGTATPFNDASEARALMRALGERALEHAVVHPFKAQIGHTLGAAGAIELFSAMSAVERGILPGACGAGEIDSDARVRLLTQNESGAPQTVLKLSSAFGGANAALVASSRARAPENARAREDAYLSPKVHVSDVGDADAIARASGYPRDKIARADRLTRLVIHAVHALKERGDDLSGAGILVGHGLATLETNALFWERARMRPSHAEPRRFPYTSPNAAPGECSVLFGLTGPSFAVGSGLHGGLEALFVARTLIRSGDAEKMVVVAVNEVGEMAKRVVPTLHEGATAWVVSSARPPEGAGWSRISEAHLRWGASAEPKAASNPAETLFAASPWGGFAHLSLVRV